MLNNSGESGQPCLVPDLSGNGFSFSPLRMMLDMGSINSFYYVEMFPLYTQGFYHEWMLNFIRLIKLM